MIPTKKLIVLKKNSEKEKKEYSSKNLGKFYFFFSLLCKLKTQTCKYKNEINQHCHICSNYICH